MKNSGRGLLMLLASAAAYCGLSMAAEPQTYRMPVELTAEDFITKVYGVLSPDRSRAELCRDCRTMLDLMPEEDNMGLWIQSDDGYEVSYYGMRIPDVAAMASIERDSIADFAFFFLFPYTDATREEMNRRQASFSGSLLQEMQDIGALMAAEPGPEDSLFEATGEYAGNFVDLRLADEPAVSGGGRYVLYLTVEPGGAPESARMPIPEAITKAGR